MQSSDREKASTSPDRVYMIQNTHIHVPGHNTCGLQTAPLATQKKMQRPGHLRWNASICTNANSSSSSGNVDNGTYQTTPTHDTTNGAQVKQKVPRERTEREGCVTPWGAQNGRAAIRQSRVHPNDRNLASWIPLWEGTSHLQSIFEGGVGTLFNPGRLMRRAHIKSLPLRTQTDTQTCRHTDTHLSPPPLLLPLPPVARPMVIVGTHGCGKAGSSKYCTLLGKRLGSTPCAVA